MKNYYHVLGVHPGATEDEIRSAFRSKAKELHPDVNPSPKAHEEFLECQQANNEKHAHDRQWSPCASTRMAIRLRGKFGEEST